MSFIHLLLALVVVLVWGFNFVVIMVGLSGIPPIFLVFLRFFFTSLPAIFLIKKPEAPFYLVFLYGLILFALQFALLFWSMAQGLSPGLASILLQLQAFFTILLAVIFFKEKPNRWQILGGLISFLGIGLVGMNLGGDITLTGLLLVILAAFFWGSGNIFSKKMGKINMFSLVVWGSFVAWPPLLAASLIFEGTDQILYSLHHLDWLSVGAVAYIVCLATWFAFGSWNWLLQRYPLPIIAPFTLLVPIIGMISSALCLNEVIQTWKIVAACLVLGGLCINLLGPRLAIRKKLEEDATIA